MGEGKGAGATLKREPPGAAQNPVQLDIIVPAGTLTATQAPSVVGKNLLIDPTTRELLRNGFPTKLHYKVELWREKGLFNDIEGSTEWEVLVQYDPAAQVYRAVRRNGRQLEDFGGYGKQRDPKTIDERHRLSPVASGFGGKGSESTRCSHAQVQDRRRADCVPVA